MDDSPVPDPVDRRSAKLLGAAATTAPPGRRRPAAAGSTPPPPSPDGSWSDAGTKQDATSSTPFLLRHPGRRQRRLGQLLLLRRPRKERQVHLARRPFVVAREWNNRDAVMQRRIRFWFNFPVNLSWPFLFLFFFLRKVRFSKGRIHHVISWFLFFSLSLYWWSKLNREGEGRVQYRVRPVQN